MFSHYGKPVNTLDFDFETTNYRRHNNCVTKLINVLKTLKEEPKQEQNKKTTGSNFGE
jgi:hypothetical protein